MKEIILSCPKCGEAVCVPAGGDEPFKRHVCGDQHIIDRLLKDTKKEQK